MTGMEDEAPLSVERYRVRQAGARRRFKRRGMLSLAWGLVGIALLEALVNFTVDRIEPALREPEYGRKLAFLRDQVRQAPDRPLMLLLGSSRTAYGLRSDTVFADQAADAPLVYNFGILGGGPVYELVYLHRLLDAGIRPRWVVIEVHPGLLNEAPELAAGHIPAIERCDARDLCVLNEYLENPLATWQHWLRYRAAACYELRSEFIRRYAASWAPARTGLDLVNLNLMRLDLTTPLGWVPLSWPRPDEALRKQRAEMCRQAYAPGYRDFEVSARTDRALREMLSICRSEGISAALLLMPEAEETRDGDVIRAQEKLGHYLAGLKNEYGVPVFDASHWCDDTDFGDGQHLLAEAAAGLSSRLGDEALGTWIASSSPGRADRFGTAAIAARRQAEAKR
ncbi:MAG TPA: DUF1574 family protein [Pirellulales bacterium]|nr:DUF1574 family protein [Pirellulales bacterium]